MILPMEAVDTYGTAVNAQADIAAEKLQAYLRTLDFSGGYEQKKFARNKAIAYMQELIDSYGDATATLAAYFYNEILDSDGASVPDAVLADTASDASIANSVRYNAKALFGENADVDLFAEMCVKSLKRYIKKTANDTMSTNAVRDRKRGVKFARVPQGAETCSWCIMLAGRGFVYANANSAGDFDHFHDNCDCKIIVGFGDDAGIAGYDHATYRQQYDDATAYDPYGHVDAAATINNMRRDIYGSIKDDRNERRRELYSRARDRKKNE